MVRREAEEEEADNGPWIVSVFVLQPERPSDGLKSVIVVEAGEELNEETGEGKTLTTLFYDL